MMNLKYYLRGLGIGIVVTALIMGIVAGTGHKALSDKEIKERAKALGMVEESTLLADATAAGEKEAQENPVAEPTKEPAAESVENNDEESGVETTAVPVEESADNSIEEPASESTPEATPEPTADPTPEPTAEPAAEPSEEPATEPAKPSGKEVTITVNKGEGSFTICKRLEDAGLIASASAFDHYLCENGYDRKMRVGSFQIPADAEPEQIAGILAGQ